MLKIFRILGIVYLFTKSCLSMAPLTGTYSAYPSIRSIEQAYIDLSNATQTVLPNADQFFELLDNFELNLQTEPVLTPDGAAELIVRLTEISLKSNTSSRAGGLVMNRPRRFVNETMGVAPV